MSFDFVNNYPKKSDLLKKLAFTEVCNLDCKYLVTLVFRLFREQNEYIYDYKKRPKIVTYKIVNYYKRYLDTFEYVTML